MQELRHWYRRLRQHIGRKISTIGRGFSEKRIGPWRKPFLKAKAADARCLLGFAVGIVEADSWHTTSCRLIDDIRICFHPSRGGHKSAWRSVA
jgi:hypothetical protein